MIDYVLADPSGNTTILVLNPVDSAERGTVSTQLLQPACVGAEQVGFLTMDASAGGNLRVDMMGGEFCGNASRSAAAYAAMKRGRERDELFVSCSGCATRLKATVQQKTENSYDATIEMPLPTTIDAVIISVDHTPRRFFRVVLPGIVHFLYVAKGATQVHRDDFWQAVRNFAVGENYEAFGLILFDPTTQDMVPAVYVRGTDTLYWEQSCGSGSAAVAAALACMGRRNTSLRLNQPGGIITAQAAVHGSDIQNVTIGGTVTLGNVRSVAVE